MLGVPPPDDAVLALPASTGFVQLHCRRSAAGSNPYILIPVHGGHGGKALGTILYCSRFPPVPDAGAYVDLFKERP